MEPDGLPSGVPIRRNIRLDLKGREPMRQLPFRQTTVQ